MLSHNQTSENTASIKQDKSTKKPGLKQQNNSEISIIPQDETLEQKSNDAGAKKGRRPKSKPVFWENLERTETPTIVVSEKKIATITNAEENKRCSQLSATTIKDQQTPTSSRKTKQSISLPQSKSTGWIALFRSLLEWEWYGDTNVVRLFLHLILTANHADGNWRGHIIERGQLISGRLQLSQRLSLSEMEIRTALKKLEKTGEITICVTNKFSLITICNYDKYQFENNETNQQINQPFNRQRNEQQPNINQISTTNNKKDKKKNEEKKDMPSSLEEVINYFKINGYREDKARQAFSHYSKLSWHDSHRIKITDWKMKMHNVWFKDENKIQQQVITSSITTSPSVLENERRRAEAKKNLQQELQKEKETR